MKKSILTTLTLLPLGLMAQSSSYGGESSGIVELLIALGIFVLIFLALRQVVLWYWKIETLIANQHEQTRALQAIYNLLDEDIKLRRKQTQSNETKSE